MISQESIISSIKKYGISCQLEISSSQKIDFKGILYYPNSNQIQSQNDFFNTDQYTESSATLIVADPKVLKYLAPDLTITTKNTKYQILKCKKFILSDQLYYISSILLPI